MKRISFLLTMAVLSAVAFLAVEVGTVSAEPNKNQITVTTDPCGPNGETYKFMINAMSKTGHILDSTGNIVVKSYTVKYLDANDPSKILDTDTFGKDQPKGFEDELITCHGVTEPIALQGFPNKVIADFVFQGFLTPRGSG